MTWRYNQATLREKQVNERATEQVSRPIYTSRREAVSISYYDINSQEYFNKSVDIDLGDLYHSFLRYLPQGTHILDGGCGCGRDTKYFLSLGYRVTAVDASKAMVQISSKLTGQETLQLDFRDLAFKGAFDGIWSFASLLHIPKSEINDVIYRFTQALKEEGVWYMSFKEGEGEQFDGARLFNNYTKSSLKKLLARHSVLEIMDVWCSPDCMGRNQQWVNALVRKHSF